MPESQNDIQISGIVVVGHRTDDLRELAAEYWQALAQTGSSFELIFVLDGRKPLALDALTLARDDGIDLKIVRLSRAFGESTALMSGFDVAVGETIVTLPAYYQVSAEAIPEIIHVPEGVDMLIAKREPRRGGFFEKFRRLTVHRILAAITGMRFSDLGCNVRIMNRRILEELRLYGDQHRFLPVLAKYAGFKVSEVAIGQSEKDAHRSAYRLREYLHRLLDIFTVFFLIRFTKKPLRFFGMIGGMTFTLGALILGVLVVERLFFDVALADRPAMLLSSLLVVLGLQLFSLGLLGELIIFTHARSLKEYKIAEIVGGSGAEDGTQDGKSAA